MKAAIKSSVLAISFDAKAFNPFVFQNKKFPIFKRNRVIIRSILGSC